MHVNAYLHFNGQCDAAFKFYEQVLGGKILMRMTYQDIPAGAPPPPEIPSPPLPPFAVRF